MPMHAVRSTLRAHAPVPALTPPPPPHPNSHASGPARHTWQGVEETLALVAACEDVAALSKVETFLMGTVPVDELATKPLRAQ